MEQALDWECFELGCCMICTELQWGGAIHMVGWDWQERTCIDIDVYLSQTNHDTAEVCWGIDG